MANQKRAGFLGWLGRSTVLLVLLRWAFFLFLAHLLSEFVGRAVSWIFCILCLLGGQPPVFPLLYGIYTSPLGYYIKDVMHPRQPSPHSVAEENRQVPGATILPVPVLGDNYAYLILCQCTHTAAAVDPADPDAVLNALPVGYELTHVLTTHKHWDHAGGNLELSQISLSNKSGKPSKRSIDARVSPKLEILGGRCDCPHATTRPVDGGDSFAVGNLKFQVFDSPGHTDGHVAFHLLGDEAKQPADSPQSAVFTGDSLFIGGVGAFFEGCSTELYQLYSLYKKDLPGNTLVFVGHEYTIRLMEAAQMTHRQNVEIYRWLEEYRHLRRSNRATVPSILERERTTNPFLLIDEGKFRDAADRALPSSNIQSLMMGDAMM